MWNFVKTLIIPSNKRKKQSQKKVQLEIISITVGISGQTLTFW